MTTQEIQDTIKKIECEMENLAYGSIARKTIGGKVRYYHQYMSEGKRVYKLIPDDQIESLKAEIERYKELKQKLKRLYSSLPKPQKSKILSDDMFECNVTIGDALTDFAQTVANWKTRDCFEQLKKYLYSPTNDRICVVFGLRRTGKSTMLRQALYGMSQENRAKAAYIKIQKSDNMAMLNSDLKRLNQLGYKYIFIDEVTLMEDFIDSAAIFSDVFASIGMKIVLSGTDSLGFRLAEDNELYDRIQPNIHTTFIPFREFSRVLGINNIDTYIQYGGTLRIGETAFGDKDAVAEDASFRNDETTRRYIDTAICKNIQHSLACYESGSHFTHLYSLYEANELTGAINRIIEDINHRFVLKVLEQDFKSTDLRLSASNMRKDRDETRRNDNFDLIDTKKVTQKLMELLEIKNQADRKIGIEQEHIVEIKEYLKSLDLIVDCPTENAEIGIPPEEHILFIQPGMRYCQAQALIYALLQDDFFISLNETEKEYIKERILEEVRGRMLEDIVLIETFKSLDGKRYKVFKLRFIVGEYDMVIYDKEQNTCQLFEIKHSEQIAEEQTRHLMDEQKLLLTERKYGKIVKKVVLYRGVDGEINGVQYQNVEMYLKDLPIQ
jgi:hypothetical protein